MVVRNVGQNTPSIMTSADALRKLGISATRYGENTTAGIGAMTFAIG